MQQRHGRLYWTYATQRTTPDHILVSSTLEHAVQRVGVWQRKQVNDSDHRLMSVELNVSAWLMLERMSIRLIRPKRKFRLSKLYLNDEQKVGLYQRAVRMTWLKLDVNEKMEHTRKSIARWKAGGGGGRGRVRQ